MQATIHIVDFTIDLEEVAIDINGQSVHGSIMDIGIEATVTVDWIDSAGFGGYPAVPDYEVEITDVHGDYEWLSYDDEISIQVTHEFIMDHLPRDIEDRAVELI